MTASVLPRGALAQLNVIHAIILRETRTRFGEYHLGYLWALVEPSLWILTFHALFTVVGRVPPFGMGIVSFIATGIVPYTMVISTAERAAQAINANRALLFYRQVKPLDLILARGTLECATNMAVFVALTGGAALWSGTGRIDNFLGVFLGLGLAGILGTCLGLVLCALSILNSSVDRVRGPLLRPLFWLSGIFFTANSIPPTLLAWVQWNPVLHVVELVRDGMFIDYQSGLASPGYVATWIIALAFVGLTLERIVRRRIEVT